MVGSNSRTCGSNSPSICMDHSRVSVSGCVRALERGWERQRFLHSPWLLAAPSASSHSVRLLTILPLRMPSLPQISPPLRGEKQKNSQTRRWEKDGVICAPAFPCREPRGNYRPTEREMHVFSPPILFFSRSPLLAVAWLPLSLSLSLVGGGYDSSERLEFTGWWNSLSLPLPLACSCTWVSMHTCSLETIFTKNTVKLNE